MRGILFPIQVTCSISSWNFYPQILVIFLRVTENKPYLPSIPQAFTYLDSWYIIQIRVRVEKSVVVCDSQEVEGRINRQEFQGGSSHGKNCKQRMSECLILAFGETVMCSCHLRVRAEVVEETKAPDVVGLEGSEEDKTVPKPFTAPPRGMPIHGAGSQGC